MHTSLILVSLFLVAQFLPSSYAQSVFFRSRVIVGENITRFGSFIEGTAVDASGSAFAVNFISSQDSTQRNQIGRLSFNGTTVTQSLDFAFDNISQFNGIRVVCDAGIPSSEKVYFAADAGNKRVIRVVQQNGISTASVFCSDQAMLQGVPNDLTVDFNRTRLYLSGQAFNANTAPTDGEIWLCQQNGTAVKLSNPQLIRGRTNGIELSLDGRKLYVSEAINVNFTPVSNKILVFDVNPVDGTISNRIVFYDFALEGTANIDIDGMRLDVRGNLYVTRNEGAEVVVFSPEGIVVMRIRLVSTRTPTNIEFAGPTGQNAIVVGRCGNAGFGEGVGCIESFLVPHQGRAFAELVSRKGLACPWL